MVLTMLVDMDHMFVGRTRGYVAAIAPYRRGNGSVIPEECVMACGDKR
jgi:hypothetical protein